LAPIDCDWSDDEAAAVDVDVSGAVSVDVAGADGVGFALIGAGLASVAPVTGLVGEDTMRSCYCDVEVASVYIYAGYTYPRVRSRLKSRAIE
jgi:hypothetical protein